LLATAFLDSLNRRHKQNKELSEALLNALRRMDWTGNVRELENTIEKLYVLNPGRVIPVEALTNEQRATVESSPVRVPTSAPEALDRASVGTDDAIRALVGLPVDEVERRLIMATLDSVGGNKSKAARHLQIGLKTLYRKLESYGVPIGE